MKRLSFAILCLLCVWSVLTGRSATGALSAKEAGSGEKIALVDDCDPTDPAWNPTGGCTLKKGDVNFAEFAMFLTSPLAGGQLIGHPAWTMSPTYLDVEWNQKLKVSNDGGRVHTFTEVANFGGGFVATLNQGQTAAPECFNNALLNMMNPKDHLDVKDLTVGNHRFQCCIHPWMRGLVKVEANGKHEDTDN